MPRAHKEREIVETAAGFGLPHDKICQLIVSERTGKPIDAKRCARRFAQSLAAWRLAFAKRSVRHSAVHSTSASGSGRQRCPNVEVG
jgi:hypothetical protein